MGIGVLHQTKQRNQDPGSLYTTSHSIADFLSVRLWNWICTRRNCYCNCWDVLGHGQKQDSLTNLMSCPCAGREEWELTALSFGFVLVHISIRPTISVLLTPSVLLICRSKFLALYPAEYLAHFILDMFHGEFQGYFRPPVRSSRITHFRLWEILLWNPSQSSVNVW